MIKDICLQQWGVEPILCLMLMESQVQKEEGI